MYGVFVVPYFLTAVCCCCCCVGCERGSVCLVCIIMSVCNVCEYVQRCEESYKWMRCFLFFLNPFCHSSLPLSLLFRPSLFFFVSCLLSLLSFVLVFFFFFFFSLTFLSFLTADILTPIIHLSSSPSSTLSQTHLNPFLLSFLPHTLLHIHSTLTLVHATHYHLHTYTHAFHTFIRSFHHFLSSFYCFFLLFILLHIYNRPRFPYHHAIKKPSYTHSLHQQQQQRSPFLPNPYLLKTDHRTKNTNPKKTLSLHHPSIPRFIQPRYFRQPHPSRRL